MTVRSRELIGDAVDLLRVHGFAPEISENGRHIKVTWNGIDGQRQVLVISRSPGDRRARAQSIAVLRRMLRTNQNGSSR
jgi:hypothetical protein